MSATATMAVRVTARHDLPGGVARLVLASDCIPLPVAAAGAHVDVHLPNGFVRQYSLCGRPGDTDAYQLAVLREPTSRGGSAWLWEHARVGTTLALGAPRNLFPLDGDAPGALLLAGGIGITPILAMAHELHRTGKPFRLHYRCRSRAAAAFSDELAAAPFAASVALHFDDEPGDLAELAAVFAQGDRQHHIYICGPAGFMAAAETTALQAGWAPTHLHQEFFSPAEADPDGNKPFEVQLASSGRVFVIPADRSIASVLMDEGVPVLLSCEQGICGTCSTLIVDGIPDHRDSYLTDEEHARNDTVLICCSRARSPRLVLDL